MGSLGVDFVVQRVSGLGASIRNLIIMSVGPATLVIRERTLTCTLVIGRRVVG